MGNVPVTFLFQRWIENGKPGSQFVYHEGYLPRDKVLVIGIGNGATYTTQNSEVTKIARFAMEAQDAGEVELVQKKVGPGEYQYIAVKRKYRRKV